MLYHVVVSCSRIEPVIVELAVEASSRTDAESKGLHYARSLNEDPRPHPPILGIKGAGVMRFWVHDAKVDAP